MAQWRLPTPPPPPRPPSVVVSNADPNDEFSDGLVGVGMALELFRGQEYEDYLEEKMIAARGLKTTRYRYNTIKLFKSKAVYQDTRKLAENTFPLRARTPDPRDSSMSRRTWELQVQRWKKSVAFIDPMMRVHPWLGAVTLHEFALWLTSWKEIQGICYEDYHKYWRSLPMAAGQQQPRPTLDTRVRHKLWMGKWY